MDIETFLQTEELEEVVRALPQFSSLLGQTVEEMGDNLAVFPESRFSRPENDDPLFGKFERRSGREHRRMVHYWPKFKEEMRLLICTEDKKYSAVRKELTTTGTKSQAVILSTISAAIAPQLGVIAGVAVPLCGITLVAIAKVGKNALCRGDRLEVKIEK
jgi:hypothetical protein